MDSINPMGSRQLERIPPSEIAALGVPVAEAETVVENEVTYQVQKLEHGSIKWKATTNRLVPSAADAVISLDADAQAAVKQWYATHPEAH